MKDFSCSVVMDATPDSLLPDPNTSVGWVVGAGWVWNAGTAAWDAGVGTNTAVASPSLVIPANTTYVLEFTLAWTGGSVVGSFATSASAALAVNGTYRVIIDGRASSFSSNVRFTGTGFQGSISAIHIYPMQTIGDSIDVRRGGKSIAFSRDHITGGFAALQNFRLECLMCPRSTIWIPIVTTWTTTLPHLNVVNNMLTDPNAAALLQMYANPYAVRFVACGGYTYGATPTIEVNGLCS